MTVTREQILDNLEAPELIYNIIFDNCNVNQSYKDYFTEIFLTSFTTKLEEENTDEIANWAVSTLNKLIS